MHSSLALILLCGALVGIGFYLILERSLSRVIIGLSCMANGVNVLFLIAGGRSGSSPFVGGAEQGTWADPLAMAMMLTSIVITLATTGFLLAMAYRTWQLRDNDRVRDDVEDRAIALRSELALQADGETRSESGTDGEEVTGEFHDETDSDVPAAAGGRAWTLRPAVTVGRRRNTKAWRRRKKARARRRAIISNPNANIGEDGRE